MGSNRAFVVFAFVASVSSVTRAASAEDAIFPATVDWSEPLGVSVDSESVPGSLVVTERYGCEIPATSVTFESVARVGVRVTNGFDVKTVYPGSSLAFDVRVGSECDASSLALQTFDQANVSNRFGGLPLQGSLMQVNETRFMLTAATTPISEPISFRALQVDHYLFEASLFASVAVFRSGTRVNRGCTCELTVSAVVPDSGGAPPSLLFVPPAAGSLLDTRPATDEECPAGGTVIRFGLDNGDGGGTALNGELESGEIEDLRIVCDGVDGVDGVDGADGADGSNGADGQEGVPGPSGEPGADGEQGQTGPAGTAGSDGSDGSDGAASLIDVTPLAGGDARCAAGGVDVSAGVDRNGDGVLQTEEVTSTAVVCSGSSGGCSVASDDPASRAWGFGVVAGFIAVFRRRRRGCQRESR